MDTDVKIFWIHAIECMCALHRLDFGLHTDPKPFWEMDSEPVLLQRKNLLN